MLLFFPPALLNEFRPPLLCVSLSLMVSTLLPAGLSYNESMSLWTLGCLFIQVGLGPLCSRFSANVLALPSSAFWPSSLMVLSFVPFSRLSSFSLSIDYFYLVPFILLYFAFFLDCIILDK